MPDAWDTKHFRVVKRDWLTIDDQSCPLCGLWTREFYDILVRPNGRTRWHGTAVCPRCIASLTDAIAAATGQEE